MKKLILIIAMTVNATPTLAQTQEADKPVVGTIQSPFSKKYLEARTAFDPHFQQKMTKFFRCYREDGTCHPIGLKEGYSTQFLHQYRGELQQGAGVRAGTLAFTGLGLLAAIYKKDAKIIKWFFENWREKAIFGIPFSTAIGSSLSGMDPRPLHHQSQVLSKDFLDGKNVFFTKRRMREYTYDLRTALKWDIDGEKPNSHVNQGSRTQSQEGKAEGPEITPKQESSAGAGAGGSV